MIDESWYVKPDGVRESASAGGIIARREGAKVWLALVREVDHPDYFLPKGRIEPGESPETAARREIEEEAGLGDLKLIDNLGTQQRFNYLKTEWKTIYYYLYTTTQDEGHPTDLQHSYLCEWFPIDGLPSLFWPDQRRLIEDNREMIVAHLNPLEE